MFFKGTNNKQKAATNNFSTLQNLFKLFERDLSQLDYIKISHNMLVKFLYFSVSTMSEILDFYFIHGKPGTFTKRNINHKYIITLSTEA
jgi:hypothetical protein